MFSNEKVIEIKNCKHCNSSFDITDKDLEFYKKVSPTFGDKKYLIPSPTLCPDCRQQRRLSFRNERKLYKRNCDASGKPIISIYSPDKPYKVYNQDFWWSDKWNPLDYGKDFDFSRTFFEQFDKIMREFPFPNLNTEEKTMINSDYCNEGGSNKNCYLSFEISQSEDCYYVNEGVKSKDCVDSLGISLCNNSYMLIDSINCNSSKYLINSNNCSFCSYCSSCISCEYCFLSSNLVNKKYYFMNTSYSKDDWDKKVKEFLSENNSNILKYFGKELNTSIHKLNNNINTENCSGDYLTNSKDCYNCFICGDSELCKYCDHLIPGEKNINSYDISYFGIGLENCYESQSIGGNPGKSFNTLFTTGSWQSSNLLYCNFCTFGNKNLFGCIGLSNKEYCILNKQYSKEEYETLVPKIIEHMQKTGEWGEFFPSSISPFGYNETVAEEYFPLSKNEALEKGFNWSDYEPPFPKVDKIIKASILPENISDIPDDILNWAIECEVSGKPFRIVKAELEFYRKHELPIPKRHPDQRHLDRLALRNPRKLFDRICDKCGKNIKTTYSPDRKEIVYCEDCYEKEVY